VCSEIAAYRWFAASAAELAPADDPAAFAQLARAVLKDPERWRTMRDRGLACAANFGLEQAGDDAIAAFEWVAGLPRGWQSRMVCATAPAKGAGKREEGRGNGREPKRVSDRGARRGILRAVPSVQAPSSLFPVPSSLPHQPTIEPQRLPRHIR